MLVNGCAIYIGDDPWRDNLDSHIGSGPFEVIALTTGPQEVWMERDYSKTYLVTSTNVQRTVVTVMGTYYGATVTYCYLLEFNDKGRFVQFESAHYGSSSGCLEGLLSNKKVVAPLPNKIPAEIAYALGRYYKSLNTADAWAWICGAANQKFADAQRTLGDWLNPKKEELVLLRSATGTSPDYRASYMWYTLAVTGGDKGAREMRKILVAGMTEKQIGQAEQMARDWQPGDCPSAEHPLGLRGES